MKKLKLFLLFINLFYSKINYSQNVYQKIFSGGRYVPTDIKKTTDKGLIAIGGVYDTLTGLSKKVLLIKLDSLGNFLWGKSFEDLIYNIGLAVEQTSDSGLIMIVNSSDSIHQSPSFMNILKTDKNGSLLWSKTFGSNNHYEGLDIKQTFDLGYIFSGGNFSYPVSTILIKTNSVGDTLWTRILKDTINSLVPGACIRQTLDSGFVTIQRGHDSNTGFYKTNLLKFDKNGNISWTKTFDGGASYLQTESVEQTNDSGFIICGAMGTSNGTDCYLIKTDEFGNFQWIKSYGDSVTEHLARGIQTKDNGYLVLSGHVISGQVYIYAIKTNSIGNIEWSKNYGNGLWESYTSAISENDEGFVFAGNDFLNSLCVIRVDSNGLSGCYESVANTYVSTPQITSSSVNLLINSGITYSTNNSIQVNNIILVESLCSISEIQEKSLSLSLFVFPNPSFGKFKLSNKNGPLGQIFIQNLLGEVVYLSTNNDYLNEAEIDLSNCSIGIYFIKSFSEGKNYSQKLVLEYGQ